MPVVGGNIGSRPKTRLADRFYKNLQENVYGIPAGVGELAKAAIGDPLQLAAEALTGGKYESDFYSPDIAKGLWKYTTEESSPFALFTGHPIEALHRASDRPADALLDYLTLGFGTAGALGKGSVMGARSGALSPKWSKFAGYKPLREVSPEMADKTTAGLRAEELSIGKDVPQILSGIESGDRVYGKPFRTPDNEIYVRPIKRKITARTDKGYGLEQKPIEMSYAKRRSSNELAARIGDALDVVRDKIPHATPVIGNMSRFNRQALIHKISNQFRGLDESLWATQIARERFRKDIAEELGIDPEDTNRLDTAEEFAVLRVGMGLQNPEDYGLLVNGFNKDITNRIEQNKITQGESELKQMSAEDYYIETAKNILDNNPGLKEDPNIMRWFYEVSSPGGRKRYRDSAGILEHPHEAISLDPRMTEPSTLLARAAAEARKAQQEGVVLREYTARKADAEAQGMEGTTLLGRAQRVMQDADFGRSVMDSPATYRLYNDLKEMNANTEYNYQQNQFLFEPEEVQDFLNENRYRELRWLMGDEEYRLRTQGTPADNPEHLANSYGVRNPTDPAAPMQPPLFTTQLPTKKQSAGAAQYSRIAPIPLYAGAPMKLFIGGGNRLDIESFFDAFKNQHNIAARNLWREEALSSFPIDRLENIKNDPSVAIEDPTNRTLSRNNADFVAVPRYRGSAEESIRQSMAWSKIADELEGKVDEEFVFLLRAMGPYVGDNRIRQMIGMTSGSANELLRKLADGGNKNEFTIMPRMFYEQMSNDLKASNRMTSMLIDAPTTVWKNLILQLRPKWIVNNLVGSTILLAMSEGMTTSVKYLLKQSTLIQRMHEKNNPNYRKLQAERGELIKLEDAGLDIDGNPIMVTGKEFTQRRMQQIGGSAPASQWSKAADRKKGEAYEDPRMAKPEKMGRAERMWNSWNRNMERITAFAARVGDEPARTAKALKVMDDRVDEAIDVVLASKRGYIDGERLVIKYGDDEISYGRMDLLGMLMSDKKLRDEVINKTLRDMIDFQNLSPFEREYIRRAFPFYSWVKGMSRVGTQWLYEHPLRVRFSTSLGKLGTTAQEEAFGGEPPSYLRTAAVAPEWLRKRGVDAFLTGAMNPAITTTDIFGMGLGMMPFVGTRGQAAGGENPLSMLNPMIGIPLQGLTGTSTFFGTSYPQYMNPGEIMVEQLKGVAPIGAMGQKWWRDWREGPSTRAVTQSGKLADVASYLGAPKPVDVRTGNARARAREEEMIRRGK